ncbi:MAG: LemA family protein [Verrucomicrobiae bacterium]|nr:LemA family protein [Verrucomicrobiae bacterium]
MKGNVWLGVIIAAIALVLIGGCAGYNRLVGLEQSAQSAWAQVQNSYQRRADLIPNLVKTVSGAANFERTVLNEVVEARSRVGQMNLPDAPTDQEKLRQFDQVQAQLSSALSRLLVVVEKYPDIKATQNFRDLQAQLEGTENRIAVARRDYNESVRAYNTAIKSIPWVFVANALGFQPKAYFEATAGAEKPPAVEFDFPSKHPSKTSK